MGNHYRLYHNKINTEGNYIPPSVGSLSSTSFYIPGSYVCPIFYANKHQGMTYDTSMNSPGFGISFDMKIIS